MTTLAGRGGSSDRNRAATSWRSLLPAGDAGAREPLALGVELRQRDAYDAARWDPRGVSAATPRELARR